MLKRVRIENFRSCKDVTIEDVSRVLVLVGRNGAGKTNVMQAVLWAASRALTGIPSEFDYRPGIDVATPISVSLDVELEGRLFRYSATFALQPGHDKQPFHFSEEVQVKGDHAVWSKIVSRNFDVISVNGAEEIRIAPGAALLTSLPALQPEGAAAIELRPLIAFLTKIRYDPLDEPNTTTELASTNIVDADDYSTWSVSSPRQSSIPMQLIHAAVNDRARFDELVELVGPNGLALLDVLDVLRMPLKLGAEKERQFFFVSVRPHGGEEGLYWYRQLSLGTRRVLRILTSLLFDGGSILMFEQPEDCVHPGLLRKLMGLLNTYSQATSTSLILASHSSVVFDTMQPSDIRLVTFADGASTVRSLTKKEIHEAQRFMDQDGPLSEFLETVD